MKLKLASLFACIILFMFSNAYGQALQITGKVKDKTSGEALNGVIVTAKGEKNKTSTDSKGTFKIACNNGSILVFSYVGMISTVNTYVFNGSLQLTLPGGQAAATRSYPFGGGTGAGAYAVYNTGLGASISTEG